MIYFNKLIFTDGRMRLTVANRPRTVLCQDRNPPSAKRRNFFLEKV